MILSASRRTDIPAFYTDWFFNRIKEGYALSPNAKNPAHPWKIDLRRENLDCIVFWTKNPEPMLQRIHELERTRIPYLFQFTVTPYGTDIEPSVPSKDHVVEVFQELSKWIGPNRVIWRYDPILFTPHHDLDHHKRQFDQLAEKLGPYTQRCVTSIYDPYKKSESNLRGLEARIPWKHEVDELLSHMVSTASAWGVSVESCAEDLNPDLGVNPGKCIDPDLIQEITGKRISTRKDSFQRSACGCVASYDIGRYESCPHGCRYCYANQVAQHAAENHTRHDPHSPFLCGA